MRQRGELFEAIIRALKNENVAVAGADRLVLTEHIAVMDLIALADALLLPRGRSGAGDRAAQSVVWFRRRRSVCHRLGPRPRLAARGADAQSRPSGKNSPRPRRGSMSWPERRGAKRRLRSTRGSSAPAARRRRFLARLGAEANDALDEFLNLALDYERRETPSLQGFLAWLRDARAEVKRDMEIARDEVRVMTVHGAKGLEAPIVILADTMTPPAGRGRRGCCELPGGAVIWAGRKDDDVPPVAAARAAALPKPRTNIAGSSTSP